MVLVATAAATAAAVVAGIVATAAVTEQREQDHGDDDHPKGAVVEKMAKAVHKKPPFF